MRYSIITINYNNSVGLRNTINSVIDQTFKDYEFIIIDGDSTDGSVDIINQYSEHITYWISEPDNGIYNAMNKGISHAHGEYCLFMNSGDSFYSANVLSKLTMFDADLIVGKVSVEGTNQFNYLREKRSLFHIFLYTPHQGALIKMSLQKKYPYDENFKVISDRKFFLQVALDKSNRIISTDIVVATLQSDTTNNTHIKTGSIEIHQLFNEMLPSSLWYDFETFHQSQCHMFYLLPYLKRMPKIDGILCNILNFVLKIKKIKP